MNKKSTIDISPQYIIAFSSAAAATAGVIAISTYAFLSRRMTKEPQDILQRCQDAIKNIERELEALG